jgi:hypothetical protein
MTVGAIAVVAYCLANIIHEGLGHGGACLLVGGRPQILNAVFFQCDEAGLARGATRIVAAAGSVLNLIAAGGLGAIGHLSKRSSPSARYFLWLLIAVNLLTAFGYLLFSGIGGFGDWAAVIDGLPETLALRVIEIALGGVLYFVVAPRLLWRGLTPFLGIDSKERAERAKTLTVFPYLVGGATYVAAGLLNPQGMKLVLLSGAAASFGGTSLLAWFFTQRARQPEPEPMDANALGIPRSIGWIALAAATLAVFVGVLGRGVQF